MTIVRSIVSIPDEGIERSSAMEIHTDGFLGPRLRIIQFWTSRNLAQESLAQELKLFIRFHSRLIRRATFSFPSICLTLGPPRHQENSQVWMTLRSRGYGKIVHCHVPCRTGRNRVFLNVSCTRQRVRVLSLRRSHKILRGFLLTGLWNLPKYSIDNRDAR